MALSKSSSALAEALKVKASTEPEPSEEEGEPMSDDDSLNVAAEEILTAFQENDAQALARGLRNFVEMCSYAKGEE